MWKLMQTECHTGCLLQYHLLHAPWDATRKPAGSFWILWRTQSWLLETSWPISTTQLDCCEDANSTTAIGWLRVCFSDSVITWKKEVLCVTARRVSNFCTRRCCFCSDVTTNYKILPCQDGIAAVILQRRWSHPKKVISNLQSSKETTKSRPRAK